MKKKAISASQLARLHEAIALQNQGRLDEADAIYADFLRKVPRHADALHLRALICLTRGRHADTARFAEAAIAAAPDVANFHNTAGEAWRRLGDLPRARKHLNAAIRLQPGFAMAHHNLSLVLASEGLSADALVASQRAVALDPRYADALAHSLELARRTGDRDIVAAMLARLEADPGEFARGAVAHHRTLQAREHLQALRFDEGIAEAERAVAAHPRFWGAWSLLGEGCNEIQDLARAELYATIAANLAPDNPNARLNLAHILKEQQRIGEAESHYRAWLARHPDDAEARFGLAGAVLMRGAYAEGWPLFEARWDLPYHGGARYLGAPAWSGEPAGRLLLYAEQGLGDSVQMLRFLPEAVRRCGGEVTLLVQAPLARLARRATGAARVEIVTEIADDDAFDAACGLMSLPGILGIASPGEAERGQYLAHDPARAAHFASRLAAHPGRKLGIVWLGGQAGSANRRRRLPEAALQPLLNVPGWTPVSLQFGVAQPRIAGQALVDLSDAITDFDDLAAAMTAVDAVVSLDSGPAHLAGALGIPTWILVPWLHDWRWGLDSSHSDWYPSATLVRQGVGGSWERPLAGLAARLAGSVDLKRSAPGWPDPGSRVVVRNEFPLVSARCRDGVVTMPLFDHYIALSLLMYGEYSPREAAVLASWLRPGDTAIDVGANLGALTLAMARAVGEAGRVIAFEPQAAIHACLQQTLSDNDLDQVELRQTAVGAGAGQTIMPRLDLAQPASVGVSVTDGNAAGDAVEVVRLDDLDLPSCRVLKIDVEGRELDVLRGAADLIARCRPVIHVECDRPGQLAPLLAFLKAQDYRVFRHEPSLFDPANFRGCPHDAFPRVVSGNLIALPPGEEAPADLRPA